MIVLFTHCTSPTSFLKGATVKVEYNNYLNIFISEKYGAEY